MQPHLISILATTAFLTVMIALRYVLIAWAVHWALWLRPRDKVHATQLNPDQPKWALIRYELSQSVLSSWIYALPAALAYEAWKGGGTMVYLDPAKYGWAWLIASGPVYLVFQDAYYYWLHRAMHFPWLFRWAHAGHHRSRQPTAFASFSFDWLEAALSAWLMPALVFFIPIHPAVIAAILTLMTIAAVLNHSGWEVLPAGFVRGPVGSWLITATHHNLHHTRYRRNFGLYFRLWDRLMGTDDMPEPPVKTPATS